MSVVITRGIETEAARTVANASIHPRQWDGKVDRQLPLSNHPLTMHLNSMKEGKKLTSLQLNWFRQDYNALAGSINEIYTDPHYGTAYSSGPAAVGTTLYARPETASLQALKNVREGMQAIIRSGSTYTDTRVLITSVTYEGSYPSFGFRVLKADTGRALEGTSLSWTLMVQSHGEKYEIGESHSEQAGNTYNYLFTDQEPFSMTSREYSEESRIVEDLKKVREVEALDRLNWRREWAALESWRYQNGDAYYPGGLRFFLNEHESANIIDWRTDTTYSSASDSVRLGTLPALQRIVRKLRPFCAPGAKRVIELSAHLWGIINESAQANGNYNIDYGTTKTGMHVKWIRGNDEEWEIWENPALDHTEQKNTAYLIVPQYINRHASNNKALNLSKGLHYVKWSDPAKQDGQNFKSYMKGGWICEESYSFRQLACHAIVDNLGLEKAA